MTFLPNKHRILAEVCKKYIYSANNCTWRVDWLRNSSNRCCSLQQSVGCPTCTNTQPVHQPDCSAVSSTWL